MRVARARRRRPAWRRARPTPGCRGTRRRCSAGQPAAHLVDHRAVVARLERARRDEQLDAGLAQRVLDLVRAVRGVDVHEDRAGLRRRELDDHPLHAVRRPDPDAVALLQSRPRSARTRPDRPPRRTPRSDSRTPWWQDTTASRSANARHGALEVRADRLAEQADVGHAVGVGRSGHGRHSPPAPDRRSSPACPPRRGETARVPAHARPATDRRRRQGPLRRARRPLHPLLVHRHPGPAQVVLDQRRRARRRLRGRHGLRRLVDHRLQRDRGVGHDRDARRVDVRRAAVAAGPRGRRPDVLRHPHPGAHAVRGRPAPRPAPRARAHERDGLRHVQRRPRARVLLLQRQRAAPRRSTRAATSTSRRSTPAPTSAARPCSRSSSSASTSSTRTTRSGRASTRSTCATPTR